MNTAFDSLTHKMQRAALGKTVDLVLSHAEKDPAKTVSYTHLTLPTKLEV